jgi:hypothetical protein
MAAIIPVVELAFVSVALAGDTLGPFAEDLFEKGAKLGKKSVKSGKKKIEELLGKESHRPARHERAQRDDRRASQSQRGRERDRLAAGIDQHRNHDRRSEDHTQLRSQSHPGPSGTHDVRNRTSHHADPRACQRNRAWASSRDSLSSSSDDGSDRELPTRREQRRRQQPLQPNGNRQDSRH